MSATSTTVRESPWAPLRMRVFRQLWLAAVVSNIGSTMHTVGAAWAMTDLSSSPVVVSLVQTAWAIPGFLVAVPAGAFADVVDRRKLILVSQVTSLLFAAALGVLQVTGVIDVPLLLIGTFLLSIAMTMSGPAWMALIPDLVGPASLTQAIGLNNIAYNGPQSVGPALAGVLIAASGPGAVFLANAASFVGIVVVTYRYRPERPGPTSTEGMREAMVAGIRYFAGAPKLRKFALRIMAAFLVSSATIGLLPVLARNRLHATSVQFGIMAAAAGVGAIVAVWLLPRARAAMSPDTIILVAGLLWASGALALSLTHWLPLAVAGVLVTGACAMATSNITYSMFMLMLPQWIRGRASSVVMLMVWLGTSVGTVVWGAIANRTTIGTAIAVAAAAQVVLVSVVTTWFRLGQPEYFEESNEQTEASRR